MSNHITFPERAQQAWQLTGCLFAGGDMCAVQVDQFPFVVGRHANQNLALQSQHVSGAHAEFFLVDSDLWIRDIGSSNGTYVNGHRTTRPVAVISGDRIQFADCEFVLNVADIEDLLVDEKKTVVRQDSFAPMWVFSQFDRLFSGELLTYFQPIVMAADESIVAYESLARSLVPGLERPNQMFEAATLLNKEVALSRESRTAALVGCDYLVDPTHTLFVNTHPSEDLFKDVLTSLAAMREARPDQKIAIEIHERAVTSVDLITRFAAEVTALGIQFAYDDFGAGQARLCELVEVPPSYIKFDASLVKNLHTAPRVQRRLVKSLVRTAQDVGSLTLAECIEDRDAADVCIDLGFDLIQGYLYGRPTNPCV